MPVTPRRRLKLPCFLSFSLSPMVHFFFVLTNQHLLKSEIASEMEDRGGRIQMAGEAAGRRKATGGWSGEPRELIAFESLF